jgi:hypothetical protein
MEKSNKAFCILRTFTSRDLKQFAEFAGSSFLNKQPHLTSFYQYLITFHPQYESEKLSSRALFKKFFTDKKFDDKNVRYLFSHLTSLLEKYLSIVNLLNDDRKFSQALIDEHMLRNNVKEFNRLFNSLIKAEDAKPRDANWFYNRFQLEYKYLIYAFSHRKRKEQSNIEKTLESLDAFYLARKLEISSEVENARNLLSKNYQSFILDDLVEKIKDHPYSKLPVISVYLRVLSLLRDQDNESHFKLLTDELKKHEASFSQNELRELYQYPLNFCVRMINTGKTLYLHHIFEIYKIIIQNKVILPDNILSQWDFKNIITTSLRLKEFDWAEKFINNYKLFIPEVERKNAVCYNSANLFFQRNQFGKALKMLSTVEFTDIVYQLDTRAMLLKIYYETDDIETLFYHFSAFRKFIRRSRTLSKYQQSSYRNLISFTQKLIKAQGDQKKIIQLNKEIENNARIADVLWLKNKISGFSNIKKKGK